jgi:hypothetical protein
MKQNLDKLKIGDKVFNSRLMLELANTRHLLMQLKVSKVVDVM